MWPWGIAYRDLWLLFRLWGVPLGRAGYLSVQLGMAGIFAAGCVAGRRLGWTRKVLLAMVWALGAAWMMLCGPATESCTYIVLAPALTWALVAEAGKGLAPAYLAAYGLLLGGVVAGLLPHTSHLHSYGMQPLGALFFLGGALAGAGRRIVGPAGQRGLEVGMAAPRAA
jgi:hypothetical protein